MGNYGIKVVREGYNVITANDEDLSMSSKFKTFKVYKVIFFESGGATEFTHGLDYVPAFIAMSEVTSGNWESSMGSYLTGGIPNFYIDDTKVYKRFGVTGDHYIILMLDPLDE